MAVSARTEITGAPDGGIPGRGGSLVRRAPGFWGRILRRGDPFIWVTGGALGLSLLMIAGILGLITWNGLAGLWPERLVHLRLRDGSDVLGVVQGREAQPGDANGADGADRRQHERLLVRIGNRDLYGLDFRWISAQEVVERTEPPDAWVVWRQEWGPFHGSVGRLQLGERILTGEEAEAAFPEAIARGKARLREIRKIERDRIGEVNRGLEAVRLEVRGLERREARAAERARRRAELESRAARLHEQYGRLEQELRALQAENARFRVTLRAVGGEEKELELSQVVRAYQPNGESVAGRLGIFFSRLGEFVSAGPRESNTEGGVLPAIFGTVLMTLLMTLAVVPFGVLAALYLREYARQGPLVSAVRIAVNNLAGVPSIVFGVFGLGFFVYLVGGSIDQLFYPERLPSPTYGTGGILWASLTLALLTVPVVMATEEALAAVPRGIREGSIACGASKFQTIWRIVLPTAAPGVMTGAILAMARGAGEVAPLMITGVVKLAPTLPLDGEFPFLHLERRFMHLGFHIYDVGFQSPNVEAARPMVYATALLLIIIVVLLNLTAIIVRNRLRRRYRSAHD